MGPSAPDELAASLLVNVPADPERPPTATLFGSSLGAKDATERLVEELVVGAGEDPTSTRIEYLQYIGAKRYLCEHASGAEPHGEGLAGGEPRPALAFAKSEFFRRGLPREPIDALVDQLGARRALGQARELDFTPWGGAYTRLDPEATAFPHRRERFLLKHAVNIDNDASTEREDAAREWLTRSCELVHPWGSGGMFPNFADPEMTTAYYGANRNRLVRIKAEYDADNLFRSLAHGKCQERLP